jgi:protein-serine/threonine kinase
MQRLLCEPEDRLGSQSSVSTSRPNSLIVNVRRSGFFGQMGGGGSTSVDGAEHIKVKSSLFGAMEAESGRKLTGSP